MARNFCIIGAGKVGTALAYLLSRQSWEFIGAASRTFESAARACKFVGKGIPAKDTVELVSTVDLVLITTPDDVIEDVCGHLAERGGFREGVVVAHCSGALSSEVLSTSHEVGAYAGSMHPLQTFATVDSAIDLLPGTYCCVEGDEEAVAVLNDVVTAIGAQPFSIPTGKKALYHAAAVVACNYLTVLEAVAAEMGATAGMDGGEYLEALMPLIRGTVQNLDEVGLPDALTGPIARGDVETVKDHLEALERDMPGVVPMYCILGQKGIDVAQQQGNIDERKADELREVLFL